MIIILIHIPHKHFEKQKPTIWIVNSIIKLSYDVIHQFAWIFQHQFEKKNKKKWLNDLFFFPPKLFIFRFLGHVPKEIQNLISKSNLIPYVAEFGLRFEKKIFAFCWKFGGSYVTVLITFWYYS